MRLNITLPAQEEVEVGTSAQEEIQVDAPAQEGGYQVLGAGPLDRPNARVKSDATIFLADVNLIFRYAPAPFCNTKR